MALTLEAEQRMRDSGVIQFFEADEQTWRGLVRETKGFVSSNFPQNSPVRRDDVAKALIPLLEVHEGFKDFRNVNKLRPKYWIKDFADLLIDRTWEQLEQEDNHV